MSSKSYLIAYAYLSQTFTINAAKNQSITRDKKAQRKAANKVKCPVKVANKRKDILDDFPSFQKYQKGEELDLEINFYTSQSVPWDVRAWCTLPPPYNHNLNQSPYSPFFLLFKIYPNQQRQNFIPLTLEPNSNTLTH